MMWLLHRRTGSATWRNRAERYARSLERYQEDSSIPDLGCLFLNSHLPWFELSGDKRVLAVLKTAGYALAGRFEHRLRYFRGRQAAGSLSIDMMANVPLINVVANETLDADLARLAVAHCRTTRDCLVRPDGSTAEEGVFDAETRRFLRPAHCRGLSVESCWARGLAWSLHGYSQMYAHSQAGDYLKVAERNAAFWIANLPEDKVPLWDFSAGSSGPSPLSVQKDSSAAAIAAAGLWNLAKQTRVPAHAVAYRTAALATLDALVEPEYLASAAPGWEGILKHGVYDAIAPMGVDESLMSGDFHFVAALMAVIAGT
jgi:unsaturated chondroitin disaccharide hydrolase